MEETTFSESNITSGPPEIHEGKFYLDDEGYVRWKPNAATLEELNKYFAKLLEETKRDHADFFEEVRENIAAYRGENEVKAGRPTVLTLPIIGREVDQLVAWELLESFRPNPFISVEPYFPATYSVTVPSMDPMMGVPMPMEKEVTAEQVAFTLSLGLDYHLRELQKMERKLKLSLKDRRIARYSILKVVWNQKQRLVDVPFKKKAGGSIEIIGRKTIEVLDGPGVDIYNVPVFNWLMPADDDDPQTAKAVFEHTPLSPEKMSERLSSGYYDLVPDADLEMLKKGTSVEWMSSAEKDVRQNIDRRFAGKPREMHDVWEVWFTWFVHAKDPMTGKKRLEEYSFVGDFHLTQKKFLYVAENPYAHKRRPYVVVPEDEETGRFAGISTVGKTKKHQALIAQMLHLDIANAVQANEFAWLVDSTSEAYTTIQQNDFKLEPGMILPGDPNNPPIVPLEGGRNHTGLMDRAMFVEEDLTRTLGSTPWKSGMPTGANRTPSSTVAQIMEAGYQKPLVELRLVSDAISELVKLYLSTLKQFNPEGLSIPMIDEETNQVLMLPMLIPSDDMISNFRFALTAADAKLEEEANQEQKMMLNKIIQENSGTIAQIAGAALDPNAPPSLKMLFSELAESVVESLKLIVQPIRRDVKKFIPNDETIRAMMEEATMAQRMMMQQQQMQQMMGGGGNAGLENMDQPGGMGAGPGEPPMEGGGGVPPDLGGGLPPEAGIQ